MFFGFSMSPQRVLRRITQLQYLLQLSWRTSENPQKAKFAEFQLWPQFWGAGTAKVA
jgi:hypothetical protein